jgi:hypothetical protein
MFGITVNMIEDYSHYSIVKDLLRLTWCAQKDAQNSTLNLKRTYSPFECSTSGGLSCPADLRVSDLVARARLQVALALDKISIAKLWWR